MAILGSLNEQEDIDSGVKNLLEPTQSPVRLVYKFYTNQYMGKRVCSIVGDEEHWVLTLGVQ